METQSETTRRGFLGHVAGAYLAVGAVSMTAVAADPIFAMIDEHVRLYALSGASVERTDAIGERHGKNGPEYEAALSEQMEASRREMAHLRLILATVPSTTAGFLAYLDHIATPMGRGQVLPEEHDFDTVCATARAFVSRMEG